MRKLLALLFVAAAFTFVACDKKGGETGAADSLKTDSVAVDPTPQPVDTAAADTSAADTAAAK